MSAEDWDATTDWAEDIEPVPGPTDQIELVRQLRAELRDRNHQLAALEPARRELAIHRAGIDTSTRLGQLFVKSYNGDVNDPEAIRSEALGLGILSPPTEAT